MMVFLFLDLAILLYVGTRAGWFFAFILFAIITAFGLSVKINGWKKTLKYSISLLIGWAVRVIMPERRFVCRKCNGIQYARWSPPDGTCVAGGKHSWEQKNKRI